VNERGLSKGKRKRRAYLKGKGKREPCTQGRRKREDCPRDEDVRLRMRTGGGCFDQVPGMFG
jgi:hypothetical protein